MVHRISKQEYLNDFANEMNKLKNQVARCDPEAIRSATEAAVISKAAFSEGDISVDLHVRQNVEIDKLNDEFVSKCRCTYE